MRTRWNSFGSASERARDIFWRYVVAHKTTFGGIALILLLSLLPLVWFKGDYLLYAGDINFPLSGTEFFHNSWHVWSANLLGRPTPMDVPNLVPYGLLAMGCDSLGFSAVAIEKIVYCLSFALCGLSMYLLTSTLVVGKRGHMIALIAAIFYMLNLNALLDLQPIPYFFYASLPLVLALFAKGIQGGRGVGYVLLMCLIWLLACTQAYTTVTFALLTWGFMLSYLCLYLITADSRQKRVRAIKFTSVAAVVWVSLNAFWILSVVLSEGDIVSAASLESAGQSWEDHFRMHSSSILDSMRLLGSWALDEGFGGDPYFPWGSMYSTAVFLAVTVLAPILAFIPLLSKRGRDRNILFFSLVALCGVFLIKGPHPPFGGLSTWFFRETYLYVPLRMVYEKIAPFVVLSYAFLIGCSVVLCYEYAKGRLAKAFLDGKFQRLTRIITGTFAATVVVILVGVYAYPLWTGRVAYPAGQVLPSAHTRIPDYYYEAAAFVNEQSEDFRILSLPMPTASACAYWWNEGADGCSAWSDPTTWLFSKPVVNSGTAGHGVAGFAASQLVEGTSANGDAAKVLALLNVKYVLVHDDMNWKVIEGHPYWPDAVSADAYETILGSENGFALERTFGELDLYRNTSWEPLHVYACRTVSLANGDAEAILSMLDSADSSVVETAFFCSEESDSAQLRFAEEPAACNGNGGFPSVSFRKSDSTKYRVDVTNATEPFFLVFSESYHPQWKAYVNSQGGDTNWIEAFFQGTIPAERHSMVNGYANAWYIDPQELGVGSEFTITLYYRPQSLFFVGCVISGLTFAGCIGYVLWDWRRKRAES